MPNRINRGDPLLDDSAPVSPMGGASEEQKAIYNAALKRQFDMKAGVQSSPQKVIVTDVDIRFTSMIGLLVKLAFAGIPAMIIVSLIIWGFVSILKLILFPISHH